MTRTNGRFISVLSFVLLGFVTMTNAACADDDNAIVAADETGTIVDVAVDGGFTTLVAAGQAAGLAE